MDLCLVHVTIHSRVGGFAYTMGGVLKGSVLIGVNGVGQFVSVKFSG